MNNKKYHYREKGLWHLPDCNIYKAYFLPPKPNMQINSLRLQFKLMAGIREVKHELISKVTLKNWIYRFILNIIEGLWQWTEYLSTSPMMISKITPDHWLKFHCYLKTLISSKFTVSSLSLFFSISSYSSFVVQLYP